METSFVFSIYPKEMLANKCYTWILVLYLIEEAVSQSCNPPNSTIEKFNLKKYKKGKWFVAYLSPQEPQEFFLQSTRCTTLQMEKQESTVVVKFEGIDSQTENKQTEEITFMVNETIWTSTDSTMYILGTDYGSWSLVQTCMINNSSTNVLSYLMTRSNQGTLEIPQQYEAFSTVNKTGVDISLTDSTLLEQYCK